MTDWQKFYAKLIGAGLMKDFEALMKGEAMERSRAACQMGQPDDVRRDALADVRFCLCRADEASKALMEAEAKAKAEASSGFHKGGSGNV